jgi:glycerophosphoryl diester phosphodiesterase
MILISHRGNIKGPNPTLENSPDYVQKALYSGFSVEIDLRMKDGELYLGHDYAQYRINEEFLVANKGRMWIHCKDSEAFTRALQLNLNCFWHNTDDYTMTSYGYVWCYPGKELVGKMSVTVLPEQVPQLVDKNWFAVCSDYVLDIKSMI